MNLNQTYKLYLDSINPKTGEIDDKLFQKRFVKFAKNDELVMSQLVNALKIDTNKTKDQSVTIGGKTVTYNLLPKSKQKEREALRQKLLKKMPQAEIDFYKANLEIRKHPYSKKDPRDFVGIFGDRIEPSSGKHIGVEVAYKLTDPLVSPKEKNQLFNKYIDDLMKYSNDVCSFSSDEEFVDKYVKIRGSGSPFMLDAIGRQFKEFANCDLDPEIEKKYYNYRAYTQDLYDGINAKAATITDPAYSLFDSKNLDKVGMLVSDNDIAMTSPNYEFDGKSEFGSEPIGMAAKLTNNHHLLPVDEKCFNAARNCGKIEKNSLFLNEKGEKISEKDAAKLFGENKQIGIIGASGKMNIMRMNEFHSVETMEISESNDHKALYGKMLADLNKGTSSFTRSSKEYKNMRNILNDLSKGKGNEQELLTSLEENANTYLNNHYQKGRISSTAGKRKNCVNEMMKGLKQVQASRGLGQKLRDNNPTLKENSDVKAVNKDGLKKKPVEIAKDHMNSAKENIKNNEKDALVNSKNKQVENQKTN